MITYQDYLDVPQNDKDVCDFIRKVINVHTSSPAYEMAKIADAYYRNRNLTIMEYQRLLYTMTGQAVPDNFAANYKLRNNLFRYFVTQEVQYLLGNGTQWTDPETKEKLGLKRKSFDSALMELATKARVQGCSFGFFNLDHVDVFGMLEFAPLYDEENGALMAGVRWWQLDDSKPLRATLYTVDGYRDMIQRGSNDPEISELKRYIYTVTTSEADGEVIYDGENYPSFPIIPMYGDNDHQSVFEGKRETLDCYDLMLSGFANTIDEASYMYWAIQNASGMDDIDLVKFVDHMKTIHAAVVEDAGARAEAHTIEAPYQGRDAMLNRARTQLFDDFMALDTKAIASGAATATQIKAAYEPLKQKTDLFEDRVRDFVYAVLELVGIDDEPVWSRSTIVNTSEEIQVVLASAQYFTDEYVTKKLLNIIGDGDKADEMLEAMANDEVQRFRDLPEEEEPQEEAVQPEDIHVE